MKKFLKENRSGFTLIELLVVIAILAVLATLYVPRILGSSANAKRTVEIANARTLASEITMYNSTRTSDFITPAGSDTLAGGKILAASDLTSSGLLNGRNFPDGNIVKIIVDDKHNAYIVDPDGVPFTGAEPTTAP